MNQNLSSGSLGSGHVGCLLSLPFYGDSDLQSGRHPLGLSCPIEQGQLPPSPASRSMGRVRALRLCMSRWGFFVLFWCQFALGGEQPNPLPKGISESFQDT